MRSGPEAFFGFTFCSRASTPFLVMVILGMFGYGEAPLLGMVFICSRVKTVQDISLTHISLTHSISDQFVVWFERCDSHVVLFLWFEVSPQVFISFIFLGIYQIIDVVHIGSLHVLTKCFPDVTKASPIMIWLSSLCFRVSPCLPSFQMFGLPGHPWKVIVWIGFISGNPFVDGIEDLNESQFWSTVLFDGIPVKNDSSKSF